MAIKIQPQKNFVIGVISDTHGWLSPSIQNIFKDAHLIIHAGDVDKPDILKELQQIAPTIAVRGNMDMGKWAHQLKDKEVIEIGSVSVCVIHNIERLEDTPSSQGVTAVINGHTHRPLVKENNGVYVINPGSASWPKFGYSASVALLHLAGAALKVRLIELEKF